MKNFELVKIKTYEDDLVANLARNRLEAENIRAFLSGESSNAIWHTGSGFGGIQLLVSRQDADRAKALIRRPAQSNAAVAPLNLACAKCGAGIDVGFEVCWSCGSTAIQLQPSQHPSPYEAENGRSEVLSADGLGDELADVETQAANDIARRAWISAIIGVFCLPFTFYSLYLLFKITFCELSPMANRKFVWAAVINFSWLATIWAAYFYM